MVVGRIEEKRAARAEYNRAMAAQETAMLLEQQNESGNEFACKIGQFQPGSVCKITISYVTQLDQQGRMNRFNLPMTIAPKYTPPSSPLTQQQLDWIHDPNSAIVAGIPNVTTAATTTTANSLKPSCSITIEVRMASRILSVSSPSHSHLVTHRRVSPSVWVVDCCVGSYYLDRHFELLVDQELGLAPRAVLEYNPVSSSCAMSVAFNPPAIESVESVNLSCELIFMIDRSGSMNGASMLSVIRDAFGARQVATAALSL